MSLTEFDAIESDLLSLIYGIQSDCLIGFRPFYIFFSLTVASSVVAATAVVAPAAPIPNTGLFKTDIDGLIPYSSLTWS